MWKRSPITHSLILLLLLLVIYYWKTAIYQIGFTVVRKRVGPLHSTVVLRDGATCNEHVPSVMISIIISSESSLGFEDNGTKRNLASVLKMLKTFQYPLTCLSLSLLISDIDYYTKLSSMIEWNFSSLGYSRATILHQTHVGSRVNAYSTTKPRKRLKLIAEAKNYLLHSSLAEEDVVLFIDAAITKVPPTGLIEMAHSGKDILTARCSMGNDSSADMGAWIGDPQFDEDRWVHRLNSTHLNDYEQLRDDLLPLDSFGSSNVWIKTDLIHRGLHFPPMFLVGTKWNSREGYDGVDSEGICYLAKAIGAQCWGMPHLEFRRSL